MNLIGIKARKASEIKINTKINKDKIEEAKIASLTNRIEDAAPEVSVAT